MNITWIKRSCLLAILLLFLGVTGCSPDPMMPLDLFVDLASGSRQDAVIITLDNPTRTNLFVPASWTGLVVYQELPTGAWVEYIYPDGFEAKVATSDRTVMYYIPADLLEPGSYKVILQGRIGLHGVPFSLEAHLEFGLISPLGGNM